MHLDWWTLALQTVNVLVLIWILARFFFRPIADVIAKRQRETDKLFADAEAARRQAAAARGEAEKARAEVAAERDRLLADAQKSAQAEKAKLLQQAAQEAAKLRHRVRSGDRARPRRGRAAGGRSREPRFPSISRGAWSDGCRRTARWMRFSTGFAVKSKACRRTRTTISLRRRPRAMRSRW